MLTYPVVPGAPHHLSQLVKPEPLIVDLVSCLLEVLHMVSQHQVPQRQEVAVILKSEIKCDAKIFCNNSNDASNLQIYGE